MDSMQAVEISRHVKIKEYWENGAGPISEAPDMGLPLCLEVKFS